MALTQVILNSKKGTYYIMIVSFFARKIVILWV